VDVIEVEQKLLGSLIKDELLLLEVGQKLKREHFSLLSSRVVYECLSRHVAMLLEGKVTEPVSKDSIKLMLYDVTKSTTLLNRGDVPYVIEFINDLGKFTTESPQLTADWIIEYANKKKIEACIKLAIDGLNKGDTAQQIASGLVDAVVDSVEVEEETTPEDLEAGFEKRFLRRKRELASGIRRRYELGFPVLDGSIGGGLQTKEILIIAGYPGVGKSRLADTFSVNLFENGHNVLKVTTENTKEQSVERAESMYFGLDYVDIKRCASNIPLKEIANRPLKANKHITIRLSQDKYRIADFFSLVKMFQIKHKFKPDVIVFDSPDFMLLTPSPGLRGGVEKKHDLITRMYSQIKTWVETNNMSIITTSHVKLADFKGRRSKRKDLLDLGDLSDSSGKVRIADIVLTLNISEEMKDMGQAELFIAKLRDAQQRTTSVMVHNHYGMPKFSEIVTQP